MTSSAAIPPPQSTDAAVATRIHVGLRPPGWLTSNTIVAEMFYRTLDPPWADLAAAQYLGGGVAWAGGEIPLLVVIVALGIQWARQDAKEARRVDRHLDSGLDEDFDVYNTMLQRLSDRQASLELKERE